MYNEMFKCRKCGCNCDNADIRNGLCDDCRNVIKSQLYVMHAATKQTEKKHILKHGKNKGCINASRKRKG